MPGRFVRGGGARNGCAVCIQIGVMDKDVHGAFTGAADDAGQPARAISAKGNTTGYRVISDLPDLLPVTEGELELLESELADFIAELLKK